MTSHLKTMPPRQPRGFVLLFTMVILVLLGIMGFSIMASTRTELSVSHDIRLGRGAFQQADLTLRAGLMAALARINDELDPCDVFRSLSGPPSDRPAYEVRFGSSPSCGTGSGSSATDLTVPRIDAPTLQHILNGYLQALETTAFEPQIRVFYGGQEVGTASVVQHIDNDAAGSSTGDAGSVPVYLVVRANGRLPRVAGEDTNYFEAESGATHSIIMGVYRYLM